MIPYLNCKEVYDYIELTKTVPISNEVRLLLENIIDPLLKSDVFFDNETYQKLLKYVNDYYYEIDEFEKFVYALFFFYDDTKKSNPVFSQILLMMGRGAGKDGLAAPLIDFMTSHYYGVNKYDIDIVANSEAQALGTFELILESKNKFEDKMKYFFKWTMQKITNRQTYSKIQFNTSNAKTKDGKRPGMVAFNEYHQYEDYSNINVHTRGLGKVPHARTFIITTDGYVRQGPLDELKEKSQMLLASYNEKPPRLCPIICKLDSEEEIDHPELYVKAYPTWNMMKSLHEVVYQDVENSKFNPDVKADTLTKRFNLPADKNQGKIFVAWEHILKTNQPLVEPNDAPAIFGIDYAELNDFAAAGFLYKVDEKYYFHHHSWVNTNNPLYAVIEKKTSLSHWESITLVDSPTIDPELIVNWFFEQAQRYSVQIIVMDQFRWSLMERAFTDRGLTVWDKKNNPYGDVIWAKRFNQELVAPYLQELFINGKIHFGDDPAMRWYTNNTGVERTNTGNMKFFKIEQKLRKNDGFQALVHAMSERARLEVTTWSPDDNPYL